MDRVFQLKKEGQPGALPAIQTLLQTPNTMVVAFTVDPGQEVPQHIHPASDDMWIIVEGEGAHYVGEDITEHIQAVVGALASPWPAAQAQNTREKENRGRSGCARERR